MVLPILALTLAAQNAATLRDQEVIQAYIQWDNRFNAKDPKPMKVVLMTTPGGQIDELCRDVLRRHFVKYPDLASFLIQDLEARAKTKADYAAFRWAKPINLTREDRQSIRMWDRVKRNLPFEREYRAELPAYSPDGKLAVLVAWEGPNDIHFIQSVSILRRTDKGWTVRQNLPAYYP